MNDRNAPRHGPGLRVAADSPVPAPRLLALVVLLVCGCGRTAADAGEASAVTAAAKAAAAPAPVATPAPAPHAATATTTAEAAAEIAGYAARRKRVRPVIGGCEESCERPERTLNALIAALGKATEDERLEALGILFDWSQLVVDGKVLGEHWAELWGDVREHARRDAEVRAWLQGWSAWSQRLAPGASLASMRGAQTRIEPVPGHGDLVVVRLRHPALRDDTTEPEWRLVLTRRGWEWLVTEIDHQPSTRPLQIERFGGSEQAGHL